MTGQTPHENMAQMIARQVAESIETKPEWFTQPDAEGRRGEAAQQAYIERVEKAAYDALLLPLTMLHNVGRTAPTPGQDAQPEHPAPLKPIEVTGCRRGYLHRPGFDCPLCGDTGERVMDAQATA